MLGIAACLVLSCATGIAAAEPANAGCSETTKFVTSGKTAYGNRSNFYVFNHNPTCGPVAHSTFVRLSPDYLNWVEGGTYQNQYDGPYSARLWAEWRYYPSPIVVKTYGSVPTGIYINFMIQNGSGTSWDIFYAGGSTVNTTYKKLVNTGQLSTYKGVAESELARYGTVDAWSSVAQLQTQASYLGSWSNWTYLGCDNSQRTILDWAVTRVSNTTWYMVHHAPVNGEC